jgi:hypothetical protein
MPGQLGASCAACITGKGGGDEYDDLALERKASNAKSIRKESVASAEKPGI